MAREDGQASLELLAGIPALVLAGLVALQLLATGYSLTLADGAAEAGAMALAAGKPAGPAVRDAPPRWARGRIHVDGGGGPLPVRLAPPSPLPAIPQGLEVSSSTGVRTPQGCPPRPRQPFRSPNPRRPRRGPISCSPRASPMPRAGLRSPRPWASR